MVRVRQLPEADIVTSSGSKLCDPSDCRRSRIGRPSEEGDSASHVELSPRWREANRKLVRQGDAMNSLKRALLKTIDIVLGKYDHSPSVETIILVYDENCLIRR
jgi:hypothetical protein